MSNRTLLYNEIEISKLTPHEKNLLIYGNESESIAELGKKIQESNWVKPIIINQNNVIISGHRRYYACKHIGREKIPYEAIFFQNEQEEICRLLLENESREKTNEQKLAEAEMWREIEQIRAKEKMSLGGQGKEILPHLDKGQTRDIVASKVGWSGKTLENAEKVGKEISKHEEAGNIKDAKFLKTVLNKTVNGAKDLIKLTPLDNIPEELKNSVIEGQITVNEGLKEIKKESANQKKEKEGKEILPEVKINEEIIEGSRQEKLPVNNEKNTLEKKLDELLQESTELEKVEVEENEPVKIIKQKAEITIDKIIELLKEVFTEEKQEMVEDMTREDKDVIQHAFTKLENEIKNIKMCTN